MKTLFFACTKSLHKSYYFSRQKLLLNLRLKLMKKHNNCIEAGGFSSQPARHGLVGLGLHMLDLTLVQDLDLSR